MLFRAIQVTAAIFHAVIRLKVMLARSEPYQYLRSALINLWHEQHLMITLHIITLINAELIDPDIFIKVSSSIHL
jgi:hypothetical protein